MIGLICVVFFSSFESCFVLPGSVFSPSLVPSLDVFVSFLNPEKPGMRGWGGGGVSSSSSVGGFIYLPSDCRRAKKMTPERRTKFLQKGVAHLDAKDLKKKKKSDNNNRFKEVCISFYFGGSNKT